MDRTNIQTRLKCVIASHGLFLEALMMSVTLGIVLPTLEEAPQAHFLQQRAAIQRQTSSSSISSKRQTPALARREQRLLERQQAAMIRKKTTVAQAASRPYLVMEDLRPAAPASSAASVPVVESSLSSSISIASSAARENFPAFQRAVHPVSRVPDWGAMTTPGEWNRTYRQLQEADFVRVPAYDLQTLLIPIKELLKDRTDLESIRILTAKLYYSTRFFGAYNLDSGEFEAVHPGIDLKLAEGTPIGAVAGGQVHAIRRDESSLGLHVIIEHHAPDGETYYSIYGHLENTTLEEGDTISAGQTIGTVGMSGNTTGPHLHLQIDRGTPDEAHHEAYWPSSVPSPTEAQKHTVNPVVFIRQYAS